MEKEKSEKTSKNGTSSEVALGSSKKSKSSQKPTERVGFFTKAGLFFTRMREAIVNYFKPVGEALTKGDWATRLSFIIMGFGFFFHGQTSTKKVRVKNDRKRSLLYYRDYSKLLFEGKKGAEKRADLKLHKPSKHYSTKQYFKTQWIRGLVSLLAEVLIVLVIVFWGLPNWPKLSMTNLVAFGDSCQYIDGDKVCGAYDNSFLILLFSIVSAVLVLVFIPIYFLTVKGVYHSQEAVKDRRPINGWKEDLHQLVDEKFYISVLAVPVLGVVIFTIVPIIFMVFIAFTNYDKTHMPPSNNFSWVGMTNFVTMFTSDKTSGFGTILGNQALWTIEWAFLATFTCFFGGLFLALLLNSKKTRFVKVWRTCFVITIAVPQFVTLMLIRYFLSKTGIVNALFAEWGFTSWAKNAGWIPNAYDYSPFLDDPTWAKWTIVIVNCWVGFPYLMLIVSGILMNIPADLYESAQIDGAGKARMFFSITMPYIFQVLTPYLISSFVSNINNFNVIYLLTSGYNTLDSSYSLASAKETDLLVTWLFSIVTGNGNKYYYASIIGIIMFAVTSLITLIAFTQTTKGNREQRFQ